MFGFIINVLEGLQSRGMECMSVSGPVWVIGDLNCWFQIYCMSEKDWVGRLQVLGQVCRSNTEEGLDGVRSRVAKLPEDAVSEDEADVDI